MNPRNRIVIRGMLGLGDNLYMIPVLRMAMDRNWDKPYVIQTPWPQLWRSQFTKEELLMCPSRTKLRTQIKNEKRLPDYYDISRAHPTVEFSYCRFHEKGLPLHEALMKSLNVTGEYDLRLKGVIPAEIPEPIAIIRPCTIRKEWSAPSRNCKPEYIQQVIDFLNDLGYMTTVIADIEEGEEYYDQARPARARQYYEKGELTLEQMIHLFSTSSIAIGPVGFMVPMSIATGCPSVVIHGGAGGWNHPDLIQAPGAGIPVHVLPENYCECKKHTHSCDKEIAWERIETAIRSVL